MDADIQDPVAPVRRRRRLRLGEAIQVGTKAARSIAPAVQCLHQPVFLIFFGLFHRDVDDLVALAHGHLGIVLVEPLLHIA